MKNNRELIINWYNQNKRNLPWRHDKDPYHVWISEIMLQQTRIEAVKLILIQIEILPLIYHLKNLKLHPIQL